MCDLGLRGMLWNY